jgi:hypothetical protein
VVGRGAGTCQRCFLLLRYRRGSDKIPFELLIPAEETLAVEERITNLMRLVYARRGFKSPIEEIQNGHTRRFPG